MSKFQNQVYVSLFHEYGRKMRYVKNTFYIVSMYISRFRIFKNFLYQGGVKSTVSWVFEDLKFKISEGYDQNWCFPDSAQLAVSAKLRQLTGQSQGNTNLGRSLLKFLNLRSSNTQKSVDFTPP